jgi:putative hydrolase of the HAD superfamily
LDQVVDHVAIGEEIGFSKPAAQAFHKVIERFSIPASEALMVGDSPELDYDAALQAGLMAVLLDRDERHLESGRPSIRTLTQVLSR